MKKRRRYKHAGVRRAWSGQAVVSVQEFALAMNIPVDTVYSRIRSSKVIAYNCNHRWWVDAVQMPE